MELNEIDIDETLHDILLNLDLLAFENTIVFDMQLTQLDHFKYVTDDELMLHGLSTFAIRRLRDALGKRQKATKKNKNKNVNRIKIIRNPSTNTEKARNGTTTPFLIPVHDVELMETIGEGTFAVVKRAFWKRSDNEKMECAAKILHNLSNETRNDIMSEISNMQKLRHQNLVQLHGAVFAEQTYMIIELCQGGSLLDRLRNKLKESLYLLTLLKYSQQIAAGMAYLESRRIVHRDLAARNILLTKNDEAVKICDFGLTRTLGENERLYIMSAQKKVPFAWCPPESLRFRQFSHKSDVWAFGVTLWEIFTNGEDPWPGCGASAVLNLIESGERLKQPDHCSKEIYDLIAACWASIPDERPKFSHIRKILLDIKFMTVVCRTDRHKISSTNELDFLNSDKIIMIRELDDDSNGENWYGQNLRTRKFGVFPRSAVAIQTPPPDKQISPTHLPRMRDPPQRKNVDQMEYSKFRDSGISCPIRGSFIHTGHGDIDENLCWGYVDKIDEIYLKNPIVKSEVEMQPNLHSNVTFTPSIHSLSSTEFALVGQPIKNVFCDESGMINQEQSESDSTWPGEYISDFSSDQLYPSLVNSTNAFYKRCSDAEDNMHFDTPSPQLRKVSPKTAIKIMNYDQNNLNSLQNTSLLPVPPPPQSKESTCSSSKYDSAISIPRPHRSSPTLKMSECLSQPSKKSNVQPTDASSILKVLTPENVVTIDTLIQPSTSISKDASIFQNQPITSNVVFHNNSNLSARNNPTQSNYSEFIGQDPFEFNEELKTLGKKLRYNDVYLNLAPELSKAQNSNPGVACPNGDGTLTSSIYTFQHYQYPNTFSSSNQLNNQNLPNKSQKTYSSENKRQSTKSIVDVSSLLPPPSDLVLNCRNEMPKNESYSSDKIHADINNKPTTHTNQFNFQTQKIFDISSPANAKNLQSSYNMPQIRRGPNGIPILDPVPFSPLSLHLSGVSTSKQPKFEEKSKAPIIDLSELDAGALIGRVRKGADFATMDECRLSLIKNNFDVKEAIRHLMIDRLIEMGLATDRDLAASALDSCDWDLNRAANQLVQHNS